MPSVIRATFEHLVGVARNSSWCWYSSDVRKFVEFAYSPDCGQKTTPYSELLPKMMAPSPIWAKYEIVGPMIAMHSVVAKSRGRQSCCVAASRIRVRASSHHAIT